MPLINEAELETMEKLLAGKSLEHRQVLRMRSYSIARRANVPVTWLQR
jgi:hypothetical protein